MINHLKLEHFKAFKTPAELDLDGKNVLIFGENGAGKSSLYQALKIIFHRKRIFDAEIEPTVTDPQDRRNAENDVLTRYNYQHTPLTNFTLEIDGTDYKAYNTAGYDVSMISRDDILADDVIDVADLLSSSIVGIADPKVFIEAKKETIEQLVNSFLKNNFYEDNLTVSLTFNNPRWIITVKDTARDTRGRNERLTEYFNEAKLHIIKLLVLLTAVLYNGAKERGDKQVLVLDDVITSMDAANRTLFIELLRKYFADYQKIVFTHSISFFNLAEHAFSIAYQQRDSWRLFQIVEHKEDSEIVPKEPQDNGVTISRQYRPGRNDGDIGNRIRKRFEFLVSELSKLLHTGGIGESSYLIAAINTPKKVYYEYDEANKKFHTVYDFVDELIAIIDADPGSLLKTQLNLVIARYGSGTEMTKLRNILSEMVMYQKVTMHPLSHSTGAIALATQKEIERSISLLIMLEKQIGALIGRDMYSL